MMDHIAPRDRDFEVDLESGMTFNEQDSSNSLNSGVKKQAKVLLPVDSGGFVDRSIKGEDRVSLCCNVSDSNGVSVENVNSVTNKNLEGEKSMDDVQKKMEKEKRKKSSNKKPSKPPRPPRGPSLDAADRKLIKEITELSMLKRARIERMKALKKMKASKASSSYGSNLFAIVFTILFCLVIISQGMSSSGAPRRFGESRVPAGRTEGGLISIYFGDPSASEPNGPGSGFPNLIDQVSGLDLQEKLRRVAG